MTDNYGKICPHLTSAAAIPFVNELSASGDVFNPFAYLADNEFTTIVVPIPSDGNYGQSNANLTSADAQPLQDDPPQLSVKYRRPPATNPEVNNFHELRSSQPRSDIWPNNLPQYRPEVSSRLELTEAALEVEVTGVSASDEEYDEIEYRLPVYDNIGYTERGIFIPKDTSFPQIHSLREATVIALGVIGEGTPPEIIEAIRDLNLKLIDNDGTPKDLSRFVKGDITCTFNQAKKYFDAKWVGITRQIWLTEVGHWKACKLVGLRCDTVIEKQDLYTNDAFHHILEEHPILTANEIARIFARDRYAIAAKFWLKKDPEGDISELVLSARGRGCSTGVLRAQIGRFLRARIINDVNNPSSISVYSVQGVGHYFLTKKGLDPLFELLDSPAHNPLHHLGMVCHRDLIAYRISQRKPYNVCEDKLLQNKERPIDINDLTSDLLNMVILPDDEWNFFDVTPVSKIPNAGRGLVAKVKIPLGTMVLVRGVFYKEDPETAEWDAYKFGAEHPETGEMYTIDAAGENGKLACAAAFMNDSRDGHQQFGIESFGAHTDGSFNVFLKSNIEIQPDEEVFFDYGNGPDSYWSHAPVQGEFAPQGQSYKKRMSSNGAGEPGSKRQKDVEPLLMRDIAPLFFAPAPDDLVSTSV